MTSVRHCKIGEVFLGNALTKQCTIQSLKIKLVNISYTLF
jgi:hypothetical protein